MHVFNCCCSKHNVFKLSFINYVMSEETNPELKKKDDEALAKFFSKCKENFWMPIAIVMTLAVVFLIVNGGVPGITGNVISESSAGEQMVTFLNEKTGGGVSLVSVEKQESFYKITVSYQRQNIPVYMSLDGNYFIQGIEEIESSASPVSDAQPSDSNIPKSDKPVAELFIMTHCPYGTQAEKGFIPAMKTLGDSADMTIRFVHYFLHAPEELETPRQVCIREEQPDNFLPYLECFLEEGDSPSCLIETNVDLDLMQTCLDNGNADKYYAEDSVLSENYGVRGSPTLIINGQQSTAGRSAASYLAGVCDAFNNAPDACNDELSSASPSPGFGYQEGEATTAQC